MADPPAPELAKELAQNALQANKDHQYALKVYTERLEAELEAVDKLLVSTPFRMSGARAHIAHQAASDLPEDDFDVDAGGSIVVPGATKAYGLIQYDRSAEVSAKCHRCTLVLT